MRCSSCGTDNAAGQKFCGQCGAALARSCPACGTDNPPEFKFCGECGTSLDAGDLDLRPTDQGTGPAATAPSATAERRFISVLFADLVGFTPFSESRDPEEVRHFLTRYFDAARQVVANFGGEVDKFIGDAVMAVWGARFANEDDAERAVRAGLELVDAVAKLGSEIGVPDLALRAGILSGEAAVGPGGNDVHGLVVGDMVNTASRIQSIAEPRTVLVGEGTFRAVGEAIAFEPMGPRELKGKSDPIPVWQATHVVAKRRGEGLAEGLEGPFVGRDEELRLLKSQLHATERDRRPRLVSVTGIGGVGKSRLAWEFLKYVDGLVQDIYWHEGRSPAYGDGVTFWALGEMVRRRAGIAESDDQSVSRAKLEACLAEYLSAEERRRIEPYLAGLLGVQEMPAGERGQLFSAFRTFFEQIAERGPTVLLFEDLHWADGGLLDFIEELPEWSADSPILVITLARPELLERRPGWGSGRRDFVSLHLGPLNEEDVRDLIAGLVPGVPAEVVDRVAQHAAGIPLYAVELVRMLLLDGKLIKSDGRFALVGELAELAVPESLHEVIGARLDRLDKPQRTLVQDASVLGLTFTRNALAALTGVSDLADQLSDLVRRELLEIERDPQSPERGQYRFVQSLIREVAYGRLTKEERRARHERLAEHYRAVGDEELAPVIADHYLNAYSAIPNAPDAPDLAGKAQRALKQAADRAAALHSHEQVLSLCERALAIPGDAEVAAQLLERAAASAGAASLPEQAERYAERALEAYRTLEDQMGWSRALGLMGQLLSDGGRSDRAVDVLSAELGDSAELADDVGMVRATAELARALFLQGDSRASAFAERALLAAEQLDEVPIIADLLVTRGTLAYLDGRYREGVALVRGGLELAVEWELPTPELRARINLGVMTWAESPVATASSLETGLDHARRIGDVNSATFLAGNLADAYVWGGRYDDALELVDEFAGFEGVARIAFLLTRSMVLALRGDAGGAKSPRAEAERLLHDVADASTEHDMKQKLMWLDLIDGNVDDTWHAVDRGFDDDVFKDVVTVEIAMHAALLTADPARIDRAVDMVARLPIRLAVANLVHDQLLAARVALRGQVDAAAEAFQRIAQRWHDLQIDRNTGLAWAELTILAPDIGAATDADAKAREAFGRLGANGLTELFDRLLSTQRSRV